MQIYASSLCETFYGFYTFTLYTLHFHHTHSCKTQLPQIVLPHHVKHDSVKLKGARMQQLISRNVNTKISKYQLAAKVHTLKYLSIIDPFTMINMQMETRSLQLKPKTFHSFRSFLEHCRSRGKC